MWTATAWRTARSWRPANGIDDDGDGQIDEGFDNDADGYTTCGSEDKEADCDDSDASINPGASETDGDSVDNNCNGQIDEGSWRVGDLIITEIMTNPDRVGDPSGEWIELYNTTNETLTLNGMELGSVTDGDYHRITPGEGEVLTVEGRSFILLGINGDTDTNGGVEVAYVYDDIVMSNESDDLYLKANGSVIDSVAWDDGETFPDSAGASMALDPNYFDSALNDQAEGWCQSIKTWGGSHRPGLPG